MHYNDYNNEHYNNDHKFTSDISEKDRKILLHILSRYSFKTIMVEKVRSAYKIYTDRGLFCLKKISNGYNRAKKGFMVSKHLKNYGFNNLAEYVMTTNKCLFIRHKKATYYLTKWINGSEISFNNKESILECTKLLADFHESSKGFVLTDDFRIKKIYGRREKQFSNRWDEIKNIINQLRKKKNTSIFDKLYIESYTIFKPYYQLTKKLLSNKEFAKLAKSMEQEAYVCHDSFYYQNILLSDETHFIIDMESCTLDMPISDLGHYIRRILSRNKYMWDFDLCKQIIEYYSFVRELSKEEITALFGIIVFPHKYWKLGKKKYIKQKDWSEQKYIKKMKKLLQQQEYIDIFIKQYKAYYNISF